MAEKFSISVLLKVIDQFGRPLADFNKKLRTAAASVRKVGESMKSIGSSMSMRVTAPLVAAGTGVVAAAISAEDAFALVRKTVNASEPGFAKLKSDLRGLSERIPIATNDLYEFGGIAGQLAIKNENIVGFTDTIAKLGATTNIAGEEAALMLGQFANITQMDQSKFEQLGNIIVRLGNTMGTTEDKIVQMGTRLAGLSSIAGLSNADIMGMASALSSVGIEAEAGGTAMTQVFKKIKEAAEGLTKDAKKTLPLFAEMTGETTKTFAKAYKKDATGTVLKFIASLGGLNKKGAPIITILDRLTMEGARISDTLIRASGAGEKFTNGIKFANDELIQNNAMTKEANERFKTLASQIKIFWNIIRNMAADIGDAVTPALRRLIERLKPIAKWFGSLSTATKQWIFVLGGIAASAGPLLFVLGSTVILISSIMSIGAVAAISITAVGAAFVGLTAVLLKSGASIDDFLVAWELLKEEFSASTLGEEGFIRQWLLPTKVAKPMILWVFERMASSARDLAYYLGKVGEFLTKIWAFAGLKTPWASTWDWFLGDPAKALPGRFSRKKQEMELARLGYDPAKSKSLFGQSTAEVLIKVAAESGTTATFGPIQKKTGPINILLESRSNVGATNTSGLMP